MKQPNPNPKSAYAMAAVDRFIKWATARNKYEQAARKGEYQNEYEALLKIENEIALN